MDATQALIDRTRKKVKFYPFNRLRFWLRSAAFVLSAGAAAYMMQFLFAHRAELLEVLSRL